MHRGGELRLYIWCCLLMLTSASWFRIPEKLDDEATRGIYYIRGLPTIDLTGLTWNSMVKMWNGLGIFNIGIDADRIVFTLRTKAGNYKDEILDLESPQSFYKSSWNKTQNVKIVIHGYTGDGTGGPLSNTKIIFAYGLVHRPENLVFVDWSNMAKQLYYDDSVANVERVGQHVAQFMFFLRNKKFVSNLSNIHIVGFSLGAHVAGIAAGYSKSVLNECVGRVSGLDPASQGFLDAPLNKRLDPSDATFVDVIHTNSGRSFFTLRYFGIPEDLGHVDFYVNGGATQPTCTLPFVGEIIGLCSHVRSVDYFVSTILGRQYRGCPCKDWETFQNVDCDGPLMGEFINQSSRGKYYVTVDKF